MGLDVMIFVFWMLSFKPTFSLSSFTFHQEVLQFLFTFCIREGSSTYLWLLVFLPTILIQACVSSSPAVHMMYSAYKLNKQGENIQPWHTAFPIWSWSIIPCWALTAASRPAHRFLRRQVRWPGIPISLQISHHLLQPHVLQPARVLCPWNFPGKNTGVGSHFLLKRIFPT